jgi:hypothetical protein
MKRLVIIAWNETENRTYVVFMDGAEIVKQAPLEALTVQAIDDWVRLAKY